MKIIVFLFCSAFLTLSCKNDDDNSHFQPTEITFTEIAKGELSGNGQEGITQSNLVVNNQTSWQNLMAQMDSYSNVSDMFSETSIDFDNYTVIAIFDTIRPHSGYSIQVDSVFEELDQITINYSEQSLSSGFAVIIQPFHIVKIPISNKPIVFQ